jgi:secreted trypsin-like serine protease
LLLALAPASGAGARGAGTRPQIVGGQPATGPGFRSLAYVTGPVSQTEVDACTGTVLSPNVVLTAAHGVLNLDTGTPYPASGYTVYTGSVDTQSPSAEVSGVSKVILDPGFNIDTFDGGDAALLELSRERPHRRSRSPAAPTSRSGSPAHSWR